MIDIPEFQGFQEKYGNSWPIDNPRDHELLKELLKGNAGGLDTKNYAPTAKQERVNEHILRDQHLVDKALDLSSTQGSSISGKKYSIGVLWRLAFSEVFSHVNVDKGVGPTFLRRLVSVTASDNSKKSNQTFPFWKELLSASVLAIAGIVLIVVGFCWPERRDGFTWARF